MSRKRNNRNSPGKQARSRREVTVPPELRDEYRQFVEEVRSAEAAATSDDTLDLRGAVDIIGRNPRLANYLNGLMQREAARAQALGRDYIPTAVSYAVPGFERDFFPDYTAGKRGSPTGSHPQSSSNSGGAWAVGGNSKNDAPQGVPNAAMLRYLADTNEWVRAAINIRRQQIGRADIAVVVNNERKPWNRALMKRIQRMLDQPNEYRDSYRSLLEPVIEDILVLDRGCISKNMNAKRQPTALYYEDGATIKIFTDWDGNPRKPRYVFEAPGTNKVVPLFNDELICISANPATYRVGLSPVQWLRHTIDAELRAIKSAEHYVDMKPPPHIIQVPGAHQTQITNLRNSYDSDIAGRKELFWMGGDNAAKVFPLTSSAKENQWLEWQQYLARKIATAFQISPQQFGFTADINKATGEVQQEIFEDTGLIPLLLLLEEYLNRELLLDFAHELPDGRADLEALNLRIVYSQISEYERIMHAEQAASIAAQSMAGLPSATLNQILLMRGEEPVPGGNTFWVNTTAGPVPWLTYDGEYGDWNPLDSIGGMLGAQDAIGGPDEDQTDPPGDTGDDKNPNKPQPADAQQANANSTGKPSSNGAKPSAAKPGTSGPKAGDASSGNGAPPNLSARYRPEMATKQHATRQRPYDARMPGRHWHPSYFRNDPEESK